jgi:hypothetical protein
MSFTPENMLVLSARLADAQRVNYNLVRVLDGL